MDDVDTIHRIASALQLEGHGTKGGFLVSAFTPDEYTSRVAEADFFLIAHVNGTAAGFILAYTSAQIRPGPPR